MITPIRRRTVKRMRSPLVAWTQCWLDANSDLWIHALRVLASSRARLSAPTIVGTFRAGLGLAMKGRRCRFPAPVLLIETPHPLRVLVAQLSASDNKPFK
jgi:hypothetical protein